MEEEVLAGGVPLLTLQMRGLMLFVEEKVEERRTARVLLLDAGQMSPSQGLCRHEPLLIFPSSALHASSVIHSDHEERHFGGVVPAMKKGLIFEGFRLRGMSLDLNVAPTGVQFAPSYKSILGFDRLAPGLDLDPDRLAPRKSSLVCAAATFTAGDLAVSETKDPAKEHWVLAADELSQPTGPAEAFATEVQLAYSVPTTVDSTKFDPIVVLVEDVRTARVSRLAFKPGSIVGLSSFCGSDGRPPRKERDMLAYYDLLQKPPRIRDRKVLHYIKGNIGPSGSACPPARAEL
jgi:hypothetical protein